jgi:hypothetical protein
LDNSLSNQMSAGMKLSVWTASYGIRIVVNVGIL